MAFITYEFCVILVAEFFFYITLEFSRNVVLVLDYNFPHNLALHTWKRWKMIWGDYNLVLSA